MKHRRNDKRIEALIKGCIPCQANSKTPKRVPILMSQKPNGPWKSIAIDFYGPIPDSRHILVAKDEYSRFPAAEFVKSTNARSTIPKLQKMFSDFGNPIKVKSDNGPPFQSDEFKKFAETECFKHHRIIPRYPQSNTSECFMKNVGKTIRITHNLGEDPETALNSYLKSYRATEHPATGKTPASLLFQGRQFRELEDENSDIESTGNSTEPYAISDDDPQSEVDDDRRIVNMEQKRERKAPKWLNDYETKFFSLHFFFTK